MCAKNAKSKGITSALCRPCFLTGKIGLARNSPSRLPSFLRPKPAPSCRAVYSPPPEPLQRSPLAVLIVGGVPVRRVMRAPWGAGAQPKSIYFFFQRFRCAASGCGAVVRFPPVSAPPACPHPQCAREPTRHQPHTLATTKRFPPAGFVTI